MVAPTPTTCYRIAGGLLLAGVALLLAACNGTKPSPHNPSIAVSALVEQEVSQSARTILESPEEAHLMALDPSPPQRAGADQTANTMQGYGILGSTTLTGASRTKAVAAVYDSISGTNGIVALCFNPRHGVRCRRGDQTIDVVICFECQSLYIYENDQRTSSVPIGHQGAATLTQLLSDAGIQIAPETK